MRVNSTGNLPSVFGRQTSARSVTPSRIFTGTPRSTVISLLSARAVVDARRLKATKQQASRECIRTRFARGAENWADNNGLIHSRLCWEGAFSAWQRRAPGRLCQGKSARDGGVVWLGQDNRFTKQEGLEGATSVITLVSVHTS